MNPTEFKNHARYLWGGRWYVALANQLGIDPETVRTMMESPIMPKDAVEALLAGMIDRRDGCALRVWQITPYTLQTAA